MPKGVITHAIANAYTRVFNDLSAYQDQKIDFIEDVMLRLTYFKTKWNDKPNLQISIDLSWEIIQGALYQWVINS